MPLEGADNLVSDPDTVNRKLNLCFAAVSMGLQGWFVRTSELRFERRLLSSVVRGGQEAGVDFRLVGSRRSIQGISARSSPTQVTAGPPVDNYSGPKTLRFARPSGLAESSPTPAIVRDLKLLETGLATGFPCERGAVGAAVGRGYMYRLLPPGKTFSI